MTWTAPATGTLSGPASAWQVDVRPAPLELGQERDVARLVMQLAAGSPNLNATSYGVSIYEVGAEQRGIDVAWRNHTLEQEGYAGLLGGTAQYKWADSNVGPFRGVPIPDGARPALGTDGTMTVYQPATGRLWELWQPKQNPLTGTWSAAWGGYVPSLIASPGYYSGGLGVAASGLLLSSGVVTIREATELRIPHALALGIPRVRKGFVHPAQRCDVSGLSTSDVALLEGQRFRLAADVDPGTLLRAPDWRGRRLPVHPLCAAIARAAQVYGFIVTDRSAVVTVPAEEGAAAADATRSVNPWAAILDGAATWNVLDGFPWDRLEALPLGWRPGASS